MIHTSRSAKETEELAVHLAAELKPGDFIALCGDLGAGKTVFARGLARGLGVRRAVPSPTFTLMRLYLDGRMPLYHFDVYRLDDADELEEIGFYEYAGGDGVCVTEWADRIADNLPESRIEVRIDGSADEPRRITIERIRRQGGK